MGVCVSRGFVVEVDNVFSAYLQADHEVCDEVFFAICSNQNKNHIGNIKLGPVNWIHQCADIGLLIGDKEYWGKGVATEAIQLVVEYAFKKLNLHKLTAGCHSTNIGSIKAFQNAGFVIEGMLKQHSFLQGRYVDAVILGLLTPGI